MRTPGRIWLLALTLCAAGALAPRLGLAQDAVPSESAPGAGRLDRATLDAIAKDLGLSLLSRSGETTLRVPLAPRDWSFGGLQPYVAVSPLLLRPGAGGVAGAAVPDREPEELSRGLGLGAGVTLRLSDRLDLFGQYLFRALPGSGDGSLAPTLRPDSEAPGLKGGFSVHF